MPDTTPTGNEVGANTPSSPGSNWGAPTHGTDGQGNDVTASFGQGKAGGELLLSDGRSRPRLIHEFGQP